MLKNSNINVADTFTLFKDKGLRVGFLVPTETGLQKSIMDAHDSLRKYFNSTNFHSYDNQQKGGVNKLIVDTTIWSETGPIETKTSLYRPETKSGDPRIWIYELSKHAKAGDLLALTTSGNHLFAINCSQVDLEQVLSSLTSNRHSKTNLMPISNGTNNVPLTQLVPTSTPSASLVAQELLGKLCEVHRRGWIETLKSGDTGVGFTLETLLGIRANSSKSPDYKGIEIKSGRNRTIKTGQSTVFSQVPNWKISNLKGSKEILAKHGRFSAKKNRVQLFHEISCLKTNSYNLMLETQNNGEQLNQIFARPDGNFDVDVTWVMEKLVSRVEEKHAESMWISAESQGRGTQEQFLYQTVKHTKGVDPLALPVLLESGAMTVHYLIKQLPSGGTKDQGYLFKMAPKYLPTLFLASQEYALADL